MKKRNRTLLNKTCIKIVANGEIRALRDFIESADDPELDLLKSKANSIVNLYGDGSRVRGLKESMDNWCKIAGIHRNA